MRPFGIRQMDRAACGGDNVASSDGQQRESAQQPYEGAGQREAQHRGQSEADKHNHHQIKAGVAARYQRTNPPTLAGGFAQYRGGYWTRGNDRCNRDHEGEHEDGDE